MNPGQSLSLTVPFLSPWGSVTALGGQDRGRWVRLLSRKHHLRWVVGVCSRINTAEGEASLVISPKKTTDKPELCVVSLDLFHGVTHFFFSFGLFGEDCAYYAPERYRFNPRNPKRSEHICTVFIRLYIRLCNLSAPVVILKTSDEQSLDKPHGLLIRGCPQGFKCYVSFSFQACVRDTGGKSLCHKDWCALLLMRMARI